MDPGPAHRRDGGRVTDPDRHRQSGGGSDTPAAGRRRAALRTVRVLPQWSHPELRGPGRGGRVPADASTAAQACPDRDPLLRLRVRARHGAQPHLPRLSLAHRRPGRMGAGPGLAHRRDHRTPTTADPPQA